MATTIESLRKLGLKVNGTEPTNNNIGNVINEIADDYTGGSGSAGVSSIGGVDGAITLGTGLSMSGQELQVSASGGGTQLYKHTTVMPFAFEDETTNLTIEFITSVSQPIAFTSNTLSEDVVAANKVIAEAIYKRVYLVNPEPGYDYYAMSYPVLGPMQMGSATPGQAGHGDVNMQNIVFLDGDQIVNATSEYVDCLAFTDTVTTY